MRTICIPIDDQGGVEPRWGKAPKVAIAKVDGGQVQAWEEFSVGWDVLHGQNGEGQHHARVAKFLMDHGVTEVAAQHMGHGMEHMLQSMHLELHLGVNGMAKTVVTQL